MNVLRGMAVCIGLTILAGGCPSSITLNDALLGQPGPSVSGAASDVDADPGDPPGADVTTIFSDPNPSGLPLALQEPPPMYSNGESRGDPEDPPGGGDSGLKEDEGDGGGGGPAQGGGAGGTLFSGTLHCDLYFWLTDGEEQYEPENTDKLDVSITFDDKGYPTSVAVPGFMFGTSVVADISRDGETTTLYAVDIAYDATFEVTMVSASFDESGGTQMLHIDYHSIAGNVDITGIGEQQVTIEILSPTEVRYDLFLRYETQFRCTFNDYLSWVDEELDCSGVLVAE